jgi:3D (Asp-Asp-Asp) domain-containing protein
MKFKSLLISLSISANILFLYAILAYNTEINMLRTHINNMITAMTDVEAKLFSMRKVNVQVTAYTAKPSSRFANGQPVAAAISPVLEQKYKIKLGDTIILFEKDKQAKFLAKVVDRTDRSETRAVVDLLFKDRKEAINFGRRNLLVSKIVE